MLLCKYNELIFHIKIIGGSRIYENHEDIEKRLKNKQILMVQIIWGLIMDVRV